MKSRAQTIIGKFSFSSLKNNLYNLHRSVRHNQIPDVNVPTPVDNDEAENSSATYGAKLNLTSIIALSSFGGFVFLAALITTIVILVRR